MSKYVAICQLTIKCQKITGNKIPIKKVKKTSVFDIPYFVTDNNKIKKIYDWAPSKSIDQILKDVIYWLINFKYLKKYF